MGHVLQTNAPQCAAMDYQAVPSSSTREVQPLMLAALQIAVQVTCYSGPACWMFVLNFSKT